LLRFKRRITRDLELWVEGRFGNVTGTIGNFRGVEVVRVDGKVRVRRFGQHWVSDGDTL